MALTSTSERILIVAHGVHKLKVITLPKDYGGSQPRAEVTIEQLRSTVCKTLDLKDTCMHISNGLKEG